MRLLRRRQEIEADVLEQPPAGAGGIGAVGAAVGEALIGGGQRGVEMQPDQRAKRRAGAEDRVGIDVAADLAGDVGFARRRQRLGDEGGLERPVGQDRRERVEQALVDLGLLAGAQPRHVADQERLASVCTACQRLNGSLSCAARQPQIVGDEIGGEPDRRREVAVDREHRPLGDAGEDEGLRRLVEHEHAALDLLPVGERAAAGRGRRGRPGR